MQRIPAPLLSMFVVPAVYLLIRIAEGDAFHDFVSRSQKNNESFENQAR